MNKALQSLFCLCAVAAMFGSCQKDDSAPNMTLHATIADHYTPNESNAKVVLNNYTPTFVDEDFVWVNSYKSIVDVNGSGVELSYEEGYGTSSYAAVYPYECVNKTAQGESNTFPVYITLPSEQNYAEDGNGNQIINAPMAAYSETDALSFQNVCALVRVRVRNNMGKGTFSLSSITITANTANLSGDATIAKDGDNFSLSISSGTKSVTLTGLTESVEENKSSKDYFIYIPPIATGNQLTVSAQGIFQKQALECTLQYQTEQADVTIDASKFGLVSMLLNGCDMTSMHSAYYFSVSANKKVYFSPGNLQYQPSSGTWRFAEEQWIALRNTQESGNCLSQTQASTTDLWIDLFGWGTSGWDESGATFYHPYDKIRDNTTNYGYGPKSGSTFTFSLVETYANADWGVYNAISNGGKRANMWRTLTNSEWSYLVNRGDASHRLFARAKVNGVAGLILLPDADVWELPSVLTMTTGSSTLSTDNVYTIEQWRLLENNGAVFLPATGQMGSETGPSTTYFLKDSHMLYYWSVTHSSTNKAFGFNTSTTTTGNPTTTAVERYYHKAVRLVADR